MSTSGGNKIRKNGEVTPDAVIQIAEELGLIIEIKSSLPENDEYWKKEAAQLLKYDDDLDGWWTPDERIAAYNVILLIDQARSLEFKAYLSKLRDLGEIVFSESLCGISFIAVSGLSEQIYFEPRWGALKDAQLATKIANGLNVPLEKVRGTYGNVKFCDCEPEIEYLLSIIWNDVLNIRKNDARYDSKVKRYLIEVNVLEIARELQKSFGHVALQGGRFSLEAEPRQVEYPKVSWVRKALDFLVAHNIASRNGDDDYTIAYWLIKRDLITHFAKMRAKEKRAKAEEIEPMLFKDIESS